jgi:hypothetical protein
MYGRGAKSGRGTPLKGKVRSTSGVEFEQFCRQLESMKGKFTPHRLRPEWVKQFLIWLSSRVSPD